jgi:hypothetical protein
VDGNPYTAIAEGIGPIVIIGACTGSKPVAKADIIVVPGLNVVLNFTEAYVASLGMVIEESTTPILVSEDERLIMVFCNARAG